MTCMQLPDSFNLDREGDDSSLFLHVHRRKNQRQVIHLLRRQISPTMQAQTADDVQRQEGSDVA